MIKSEIFQKRRTIFIKENKYVRESEIKLNETHGFTNTFAKTFKKEKNS